MKHDSAGQAIRHTTNELSIHVVDIKDTRVNEGIDSELLKMRIALLEMRLVELEHVFHACDELVEIREDACRTLFMLEDELATKSTASK